MLGTGLYGQDYKQTLDRIKSIYVYNFMKDIEWSGVSDTEARICVLEAGGFKDELQKLATTKNLNGKSITVNIIPSASDCRACDVLFIEESAATKRFKREGSFKGLIITHGFYDRSITNVALLFNENKLQFSINTDLCNKLGFKISSHLSSLANQKLITP